MTAWGGCPAPVATSVTGTVAPPVSTARAPYRLLGAEVSYYTAKIRACLRYKRVSFVDVLATREVFEQHILPVVGYPVIPVLVTPAGVTVQDTSEMIDLVEACEPGPAVLPARAAGRVLSYLLEMLGDEWLKMPAMHYRWHYNHDFAVAEFGRNNDPALPPAEQRRIGEKIASRFSTWREPLGITPATIATVEADFLAFLALLEAHLAVTPYLLGDRPTLGDFAFHGPLHAHLLRDPASGVILRVRAPAVVDWLERLHAGSAAPGPAPEALPPTLRPVLQLLLRDFLPILLASIAAQQNWLAAHPEVDELPRHFASHRVVLGRGTPLEVEVTRACFSYDQWMLQRVLDALAAAPASERPEAEAWLHDIGAGELVGLTLPRRIARRHYRLVRVRDDE